MAKKKVILFIVEGISDELALEGSLRNIYKPNEIKFCIVRSDITTKIGVNKNNIKNKITELIKNELERAPYVKKDILKIIHFTDMDGAYIDKSAIVEDLNCVKFTYSETNICACSKDKVIERNFKKSENLDALSTMTKVYSNLSYSLYYFSCDQEHVLHNLMNVETKDKERLAEEFNDRYEDNFEGFKNFITSNEIKVDGNHRETWEFIKKDNNSLKRYSNLHLLLEDEGQ